MFRLVNDGEQRWNVHFEPCTYYLYLQEYRWIHNICSAYSVLLVYTVLSYWTHHFLEKITEHGLLLIRARFIFCSKMTLRLLISDSHASIGLQEVLAITNVGVVILKTIFRRYLCLWHFIPTYNFTTSRYSNHHSFGRPTFLSNVV